MPQNTFASYWSRVASTYGDDVSAYWSDAGSALDFLRVMQVRLAQSKIGKLVCPSPITSDVRLRTFGKNTVRLRSHTTDISVLNEILVSAGYDALLRHPWGQPRFIVDLGANTGLVDRWLLHHFPSAEIVAVEPEPGNTATLRANVSDLPVRVVEACIGATARTVTLHTSSGEHGFTMVGVAEAGEPTFEVPVVTMETVLEGAEKIDLLKVDIEGAEEELFGDCAGWIDKVELLLVECHGHYGIKNLLADLSRAGAEFRVLEEDIKPDWNLAVGLLERVRP